MSGGELDPQAELADIVRSLRASIEWQMESGATGLPRDPEAKEKAARALAAARPQESQPAASAARGPSLADSASIPASSSEQTTDQSASPTSISTAPQVHLPVTHANLPDTLTELQELVTHCQACELHTTRTQTVFARGNGSSGLCFVGEGPGVDEDAQGEPFVGKAGILLDKMIAAMGFSREEVYVANIVKCRPPKNRKPHPREMQACVAYLHRQLEIVQPQAIVALGATAVEGLLGASGGITRIRGRFRLYRGEVAVMPTFHPAYLLRNASAKRDVWNDLRQVVHHMGRKLPSETKGEPQRS